MPASDTSNVATPADKLDTILTYVSSNGMDLALKIFAALAFWIVGRWVIGLVVRLINDGVSRSGKIDPTMSKYIASIASVLMTAGLVLGILGYMGVETTAFAALLAGAGLAIGTAWGGLLSHFAAGIFMQVLRPIKVGDYVSAAGSEGTVTELGLFVTKLITADNVTAIIGNNSVFSSTIKNFSTLPHRRVDCVAKVANGVDTNEAIAKLKAAVALIPNVIQSPAPDVEILQFTPEGPLLCVRPYCHTDNYWQVYFDTNKAISATLAAAGYPVPMTPTVQKNVTA